MHNTFEDDHNSLWYLLLRLPILSQRRKRDSYRHHT